MNNATVSIVIPVYNRAHLVSRAIDSALAQTVACEVVLVDHGSSDDISSIVDKYGDGIRYVRRDTDQGPIASWLDGAQQATGQFLHFTYDDDWLQPTFVQECLNQFSEDVAFVYTRATLHGSDLKPLREILRHPAGIHSVDDLVQHLLSTPLAISPGCAMFRRSDVLKNLMTEIPGAKGPYGKNSGVGEDLLLFLLTSLDYGKYVHIPKALADFLAHPGSITINAQRTGRDEALAGSYRVAKAFYMTRKNANKPLSGLRKLIFDAWWAFRSLVP
jgi:glycosyltransferase involved in cell wall biosynthesis